MKKFISLLLVFSVLALSIPLTAKERKGADLIIQRTNSTQVRGELIAVKENSLVLLERESGADVTVGVGDIRVITHVKKSKLLKGAGWGVLTGAGLAAGFAAYRYLTDTYRWESDDWAIAGILVAFVAGVGLAIGGLVGFIAGADKTIQIQYLSDSEVKEILEKFRKKARIKNAQ
jgi:hypothetical protein